MPEKPQLSKATFRGTLIFIVVMMVIFVLPDVLFHFSARPPLHISYASKAERNAYSELKRNAVRQPRAQGKRSKFRSPPEKFDPNLYTAEEWMALGLSEKQAAVILKFSKRGLRSNEDLRKIFVISDELFALVKDSTVYPVRTYGEPAVAVSGGEKPYAEKPVMVELNTATEEELLKVKGIGPFFARQILKRRDQLGGYTSTAQLLEVWKMDEEKLAVIQPSVTVNLRAVRKININSATAEELKAHPYIGYSVANSIVKVREQYGPYQSIDGLKKSVLVTDELLSSLRPYLEI